MNEFSTYLIRVNKELNKIKKKGYIKHLSMEAENYLTTLELFIGKDKYMLYIHAYICRLRLYYAPKCVLVRKGVRVKLLSETK